IIRPQQMDKGFLGFRLPYLDFSHNTPGIMEALQYCDYCARENGGVPRCVEVCPTEALSPAAGENADNFVLGVAELDTVLCMAYRSGYCAFCHDACVEARGEANAAIYYVGSETDHSRLPVVDADKCNGCGACESVCVSVQAGSTRDTKERAIMVRPLSGR
ncbi:MAG: 4Fe-4S binding protein, partial [Eggerthellaceae bacterium]|nr:4Fe-4S binding protein [Eggerthellaceae bacterium]